MDIAARFESGIIELLDNNDDIEDIHQLLSTVFNVNISPYFCSSLFVPLIQHAIHSDQLLEQLETYSNVFTDLYQYILSKVFVPANSFFNECVSLIKEILLVFEEEHIENLKYGINLQDLDDDILLNILAILTKSCSSIMLIDIKEMKSNLNLNIIWSCLPGILDCGTIEASNTISILIKSATSVIESFIENRFIVIYNTHVENILFSSVSLLNQDILPESILNQVSNSISSIIEKYPAIKLCDPYRLAALTNNLATLVQQKEFNKVNIRATLNLSCLILKNYTKTPWLDDILSITHIDELDIIKEKSILLSQATENIIFSNDQQDMDIDQHSLQPEKQDLNSVFKCRRVHKILFNKVGPIVNQLTCLEGTNAERHALITKLTEISTFTDNTDILFICQNYMKEITEFVTHILVTDPDIAQSITYMFGFTRYQFISKFIRYALPYSIFQIETNKVLKGIANTLEIVPTKLIEEYGYHIVLAILLESNPETKKNNLSKLQKGKKNSYKVWAIANATKITTILAMNLGREDLKDQSLIALEEMKDIIFSSPLSDPVSLSQYIAQYFIGISTKISRFITEKRSKSVNIHDPHALNSLKEIMVLLDSKINIHAPLLMKLFQTVNELDDMQLEALSLWEIFISTIDNSALISNFNSIVHGLLKILPISTHNVRLMVASLLHTVFDRQIESVSPNLSDLPILPEFEELKPLKDYLQQRLTKKVQSRHKTLREIMSRLNGSDDVQVLFELQKLNILLSDIFQEFRIDVGMLFSQLLYLIRKYASNKEISHLVALCFGKVGAIDPSLINVQMIDHDVFIMDAFKLQKENRTFICQLLSTHIFTAYNSVKNEYILQFLQMSIQSLLKCADFVDESDLKAEPLLSKPVKEFLVPYLNSSFQCSFRQENTLYPIFTQVNTFNEWIQKWYCLMITEASGTAKTIFEACLPIVESDVVDITIYLIPYVVLHTILLGSSEGTAGILEEMLIILNTNAEPQIDLDRKSMNRKSLQVVVSITEYCRKWLNNIRPGETSKSSEANRVRRFLGEIPDKTMAIAAYHSKAYPQALMHFETHLKSQKSVVIEPEILKYLQNIYTRMENRVDLNALLKGRSNILTHDEEIIRFEMTGKWEEAEILYKNRISDNSHDPSLYTGYIDCLKKWGKYETILYSSDKATAALPNYVNEINSLRIDSAWRVNDWHILDKAVTLPMQKTHEALVGCIISKMRNKQHLEAACLLQEARQNLVDQLTSDFTKSYRKSYHTIYNLQMLQELETAQTVWESKHPMDSIEKLRKNWDYNYQNIVSNYQYKHNLLELRKAAFFDIRPKSNIVVEASTAWLKIAKSARKAGNLYTAYDAILKAEKISGIPYYNEKAKWYWARGSKKDAWNLIISMSTLEKMKHEDAILIAKFCDQESSLLDKSKVRKYFASAMKNGELSEKILHSCTLYYNKLLVGYEDINTRIKILAYIAKTSAKALQHGSEYYYSSMSMLINSWFELAMCQRNPPSFPNDDSLQTKRKALMFNMEENLKSINTLMKTITDQVAVSQFSLFLTRLISYLTFDNADIAECLMAIIGDVFVEFPKSSIWLLLAVENSGEPFVADRVKMILNIAQERHKDTLIPKIISQARLLVQALHELANLKFDKSTRGELDLRSEPKVRNLLNLRQLEVYIPTEASLYPTLPQLTDRGSITSRMFPTDLPYINSIDSTITVMYSLQKPKRFTIHGSDGKKYRFLVKTDDDLRKDARTMEFNYAINSFLKKNPESRDNELYIRTYAVIPLGDRWGLIQWINNISPLKTIVNDQWKIDGYSNVQDMSMIFNKYSLQLPRDIYKVFNDTILPKCPPVLYKWFLKCFPEPNQWLASRTRYTKTLAVMSIVGYMIGLGDRHAENILFDETNGDCVHVDLNMLFDIGSVLAVPEVVPFRLTHNLVDAMGILGYSGTFTVTCEITMNVLLQNKDALTSVFQTLGNVWIFQRDDPKRQFTQRLQSEMKYKEQMEQKFKIKPGAAAKVKVEQLISAAANPKNLAKMFAGWAPFV